MILVIIENRVFCRRIFSAVFGTIGIDVYRIVFYSCLKFGFLKNYLSLLFGHGFIISGGIIGSPTSKYAILINQSLFFVVKEIASGTVGAVTILVKGITHLTLELLVDHCSILQFIASMCEVAPIALVTVPSLEPMLTDFRLFLLYALEADLFTTGYSNLVHALNRHII